VSAHRAPIEAAAQRTANAVQGRLWLPPELATSFTAAQRRTLSVLDSLEQRLAAVRDGFAGLPVDVTSRETAPLPVALPA
jgi:MoxR-like ATPase